MTLQLNATHPYLHSQIQALENKAKLDERNTGVIELMSHSNYKKFSSEQRFFFLLSKVYGYSGDWRDVEDEGEWARLLSITTYIFTSNDQIDKIINIAKIYGVINLHPQIPSLHPKFIIACGHGSFNDEHDHRDADTLDLLIDKNPTWVGEFGVGAKQKYLSEVCKGYYQTIVDEGMFGSYKQEVWEEVESLLRPGGLFLGHSEPWHQDAPLSSDSSLRLHAFQLQGRDRVYNVFTKALVDNTHPTTVKLIDIPLGIINPHHPDSADYVEFSLD